MELLSYWKAFVRHKIDTLSTSTIVIFTYITALIYIWTKLETQGFNGSYTLLPTYGHVLAVSMIFAPFLGIIQYWMNGFIFTLFILLAGGDNNGKKARRLLILSNIPNIIVTVPIIFNKLLFWNTSIGSRQLYTFQSPIEIYITILTLFISVVLLITGVIWGFNAPVKRTLLVFLGIPMFMLGILVTLSTPI